jgi:CheY-like chemotaxis protein
MMPEMDGYEASRTIRQLEREQPDDLNRRQPVHIIAMTANAMQGDSDKCRGAGMDDYVSKPVQISELRRALEQWRPVTAAAASSAVADSATLTHPTTSTATSIAEVADIPAPVDAERLHEVTLKQPEKLRRLSSLYLKQADEIVAGLRTAIQNRDAKDVNALAHKLCGASSSLGMNAIVPFLAELERLGQNGDLTAAPEAFEQAAQQLERIRQYLADHFGIASPESISRS